MNDPCKGVREAALDRGKVATKGSARLLGSFGARKAYQKCPQLRQEAWDFVHPHQSVVILGEADPSVQDNTWEKTWLPSDKSGH